MTLFGGRSSSPWQNRPSVLSVWNEAMAGVASGSIATQNLQQDGRSTFAIPVAVARACRLTRYGIYILTTTYTGTVTVNVQKSTDCGASWGAAVTGAFAVSEGGETVRICNCGDINEIFDECDLYRVQITYSPAITSPTTRLVLHFELR